MVPDGEWLWQDQYRWRLHRAGIANCLSKISGGPGSLCSGKQQRHCRKRQHCTSCAFERQQNLDRQPWRLQMRGWFCRRQDHFLNRRPQAAAAQREGTNWSCWRRGPSWATHPSNLRQRHRWPRTCSGQSFWWFGFERLWRRRNTWGESDRGRCQQRRLCFHCQWWHLGLRGFGWSRWRTCSEAEKGWGGGYSGGIALSCQVEVDGDVWHVLRWHHVCVDTTPLAWRDAQGMVRHFFLNAFHMWFDWIPDWDLWNATHVQLSWLLSFTGRRLVACMLPRMRGTKIDLFVCLWFRKNISENLLEWWCALSSWLDARVLLADVGCVKACYFLSHSPSNSELQMLLRSTYPNCNFKFILPG